MSCDFEHSYHLLRDTLASSDHKTRLNLRIDLTFATLAMCSDAVC